MAPVALLLACGRSELELGPFETTPQDGALGGNGALGTGARDSHGGSPAGGRGGAAAHTGPGGRSAGGRPDSGRGGAGGRGGAATASGGRGGAATASGGRGGATAGAPNGGRGGVAGSPAAGMGGQSQPMPLVQCDFALTPNLEGPAPVELENDPTSAVSGDFDADGKLDLATANIYGGVTILLGRGDGSFAPPRNYATHLESMEPVSGFVTAADLDQNGTLDLVVSAESPFLSILWGAGDGTFDSSDAYAFYTDVTAVVLGDFDADTRPDITVATQPRNGDTELQFLRNTGHGVFDGTIVTLTPNHVSSLAAADLNEDGQLDLVSVGDTEVVTFLGSGAGTFSRGAAYTNTAFPSPTRVGDFNGDGHVDLALPYRCGMEKLFPSSAVHLLLGHGDGSFGPDASYPVQHCINAVLVDHVNGDAALDVIASPTGVLLGAGDGSFAPELQSPDVGSGGLLGAGDWNGDGKVDIAVANGDWLAVHLGNGDGTFGSVTQATTGVGPNSLVLADFDQDGVLDVATSNQDARSNDPSGNSVSVLRGSGDGTFQSHVDYRAGAPPKSLASADLDGDGWLDLLVVESDETLSVMSGTGNGAFALPVSYDAGIYPTALALGDLNDDGTPDAVVSNASADWVMLLFGNGDGTFGRAVPLALPARAADVSLLDLDGDAKLDVAFCDAAGSVGILYGDGHGNFVAARTYPASGTPMSVRGADLDGDGMNDLVVATGSSVSVRLGSGNGELGNATDYSVAGSYLTLVDFNRDGHLDVVANNPGITIMLGAGDGTFTCFEEFAPGVTMTNARVGDVNRDGRLDIVTATYGGVDVFLDAARR